jgi:hypothetical protein
MAIEILVWYTDDSARPPAPGVTFELVINDDNPVTPQQTITVTSNGSGRASACLQYPVRSVMRVESTVPAYPAIPPRVPNVVRLPASC